jgi:orotidine-5'-phosphate decarboxylase
VAERHFADRLFESAAKKNSVVCVGLDPRAEWLPASLGKPPESFVPFCAAIVAAVKSYVAAAKVQVAFFEEHGAPGWAAFEKVCGQARDAGLPVIADVKRGDISETAEAYARGLLDRMPVDALTVSPYLGADSVQPFLERCRRGKGMFVLAKTSNRSSSDFQDLEAGGLPLYLHVARKVRAWGKELLGESGYSAVGLVAGATHPQQAARLRAEAPDLPFLVPGYGAQGASAGDIAACFDRAGRGAIVNASRSIIFAYRGARAASKYKESEFARAAEDAARSMRDEIRAVLPGR